MGKFFSILAVLLILTPLTAMAQEGGKSSPLPPAEAALAVDTPAKSSSGLPIPRFVSLSAEKVFVRTGPALRYPIKWVLQKDHLPVEIIQEYDTWRKIRDVDGDDGWVHQSMLSGKRTAIVKGMGEANLAVRKSQEPESRILAFLEPNVIATVYGCGGAWCEVEAEGYRGWVERKFLWGIYDSEEFN